MLLLLLSQQMMRRKISLLFKILFSKWMIFQPLPFQRDANFLSITSSDFLSSLSLSLFPSLNVLTSNLSFHLSTCVSLSLLSHLVFVSSLWPLYISLIVSLSHSCPSIFLCCITSFILSVSFVGHSHSHSWSPHCLSFLSITPAMTHRLSLRCAAFQLIPLPEDTWSSG